MMHYFPHLVDAERIPADEGPASFPVYDIFPHNKTWVPASGSLSPARGATAEKGELLAADSIEGIVCDVKEVFGI